ncbi:MAG TPA: hypothetical protein VMH89_04470 [Candidatus Acidoferrum sp.]|nr:hypothetical protein [Candidatus Acidoferrum sp.]
MDRVQAELMVAIDIASYEFHGEDVWLRAAGTARLENTEKNHGAFRKHVLKRYMFSGEIVPIEIAGFHKEHFVFIPSGDFDEMYF